MMKLSAEKKARPELNNRKGVKTLWLLKAEMIDVLKDTKELEKMYKELLKNLDFVFTEAVRTFRFRLLTM